MMLSTALTEMIDNTECVIFFNTPSSINMSDELNSIKKKEKTTSPWIYHELIMTTMLKPKEPKRNPIILEHSSCYNKRTSSIEINYDVSKTLELMPTLTDENLKLWRKQWEGISNNYTASSLDILYGIIFPQRKD